MKRVFHQLILLCTFALVSAASSQEPPLTSAGSAVWRAASDEELDHMRGGFNFGGGLTVSFGMTRSTYLNGQLVATTTLQFSDLLMATKAADSAALALPNGATVAQLIQNGPGNKVDPGAMQLPLATYVQNTLNDQVIRNRTLIDATTNSMGIFRGMQLRSSITDSISNATWLR